MLANQALAAPTTYTTPNVVTTAGATSTTFNGQTFVNQGLQGVARLPASTLDFNGDTFGAFSGLDVLPGTWRKNATGYSGTLFALPDRGPNGVGNVTFSDYPGRVSSFTMNFTPYTSTTNLPVSADSQQQLGLVQTGGFFFKDFNGKVTTGLDPGTGDTAFVTQDGKSLPGSTTGAAAGKISLDAEGLRFLNNGAFYVSDEYGANVYYFDKTGNMKGVIQPPAALMPRTATGLSFTSLTDATTGRRLNQGLEGIALTPDNKKLATLLQSAPMQDSTTAQQTRTNTRLMIYDISQNATPGAPVSHYVMQLPVFTSNGNGTAANRTAAQSELLALNDTQFLVLSRDGNGLGQALLNPVYKSVLLIDTAGATNIAGTPFETTTTSVAPGGVLNSTITPVSQVEVINILNTTQLGKFGININNTAPTRLTLTEKLEGMALLPALDESAPQDFFLLVANDNDFLSSTCSVGGQNCAQSVNSDALVLSYRMTLPTYVDSQYLQAMSAAAPTTIGMTAQAARDLSLLNSDNVGQHFLTQRHGGAAAVQTSGNIAVWAAGDWLSRSESGSLVGVRSTGATVGFDSNLNDQIVLGASVGYYEGEPKTSGTYNADQESYQFSLYGSLRSGGLYANAIGSYGDMRFENITRAGAYGQTASGDTNINTFTFTGELGYLMSRGNVQFGPLAGLRWMETAIGDYIESGAAGGNIAYPSLKSDGSATYVGGEASMDLGSMRSILRLTYTGESDVDSNVARLRLASANHAMGTQSVVVEHFSQAVIEPSLTLTGFVSENWNWWLNLGARIGEEEGTEHRVGAGLRIPF
ncbi:MAG: esterase-like activity of phytase family protein [Pseudomonadota bacterium]